MSSSKLGKIRAALVALAAAAVAVVGMAVPASAGPGSMRDCYFIDGKLHCYLVAVNWDWRWECPMCGMMIDWTNDAVINPSAETKINGYLTHSLQELGAAAMTSDPVAAAKLRTEALNEATQAARIVGGSRLRVDQVGVANPETNRFDPEPSPWLQAAGADLADAVGLLQQALDSTGPIAARYRSLASVQLDQAYNEMAGQRVIEG